MTENNLKVNNIENRIRFESLLDKDVKAEEAVWLIEDGMTIATSGFTPSGYPKSVPLALARRKEDENLDLKVNLLTGASVGDELDGAWARADLIDKRLPYQTNESLRNHTNKGKCNYLDMHLSHVPNYAKLGFLGRIDVAIVEAAGITEEGYIIPTTSVGATPTYVEMAEKVIVEINTTQPVELEGMHDIYMPQKPPLKAPIPIFKTEDRIGDSLHSM